MSDKLASLKKDAHALRNISAMNKYYTFLAENEEIWLGPFKHDVLDLVIQRADILKKWGTKNVIFPIAIEENDWLIFKDFTAEYAFDDKNTKRNDKKEFNIAYIKEISTQNVICGTEKWIYGEQKLEGYNPADLLTTYIHLWLLNVGNSLFSDTFVDLKKKKLIILDYDLERDANKENKEQYFFFIKTPSKHCDWFKYMGKYYNQVADDIENIVQLSPEYENRVRYAQELLKEHYQKWKNIYVGESSPSRIFPTGKSDVNILGTRPTPPLKPLSLRPLSSRPESLDLGKMSSHQRGGITYSGFSFNEMKKYLRSYIQRGLTSEARMIGAELYRIKELSDTSAKANFTSFINILRLIAVEDVGIGNFDLVIDIVDFLNRNSSPTFDKIDGMIIDMCESKKSHLSEQIWKVFTNASCIKYGSQKYNMKVDNEFSDEDYNFIDKYSNLDLFNKKDPIDLKNYALVFYERLINKDYNAITWWNYFVNAALKICSNVIVPRNTYHDGENWKRVGQKEPTIILWDIISKIYGDTGAGIINSLRWAYFEHIKTPGAKFFPLLAILAYINDVPDQGIGKINPSEDFDFLLKGEYELKLDASLLPKKSKYDVELNPENKEFHFDEYIDISNHC